MFSIDVCRHKYCFSCMKRHVKDKFLQGMLPKCPHLGCNSKVKIDSCSNFFAPELVEIMRERIKEAAIPVSEKVYCPNPKCSVLMSKRDLKQKSGSADWGQCIKCSLYFCINCKIPWHYKMTCNDYKISNPYPQQDASLRSMAKQRLWRQCIQCSHMIELAEGCFHITCRCGYQFCYRCGAEYKDKAATCKCPLWDERYIIRGR